MSPCLHRWPPSQPPSFEASSGPLCWAFWWGWRTHIVTIDGSFKRPSAPHQTLSEACLRRPCIFPTGASLSPPRIISARPRCAPRHFCACISDHPRSSRAAGGK